MIDLDAIKKRCDAADIPALVAEIERLRMELDEFALLHTFCSPIDAGPPSPFDAE